MSIQNFFHFLLKLLQRNFKVNVLILYCSIFKELSLSSADSLFIISHLHSLVKHFFYFFEKVFWLKIRETAVQKGWTLFLPPLNFLPSWRVPIYHNILKRKCQAFFEKIFKNFSPLIYSVCRNFKYCILYYINRWLSLRCGYCSPQPPYPLPP